MQLQCIATFGGLQVKLQQMKVVVCCLDGENLVGSLKDPVYVAYRYLLEAHDETAESALLLYCILLLQVAWPKLSCVYCTGKVPGWYFRHEMSAIDMYVRQPQHTRMK